MLVSRKRNEMIGIVVASFALIVFFASLAMVVKIIDSADKEETK